MVLQWHGLMVKLIISLQGVSIGFFFFQFSLGLYSACVDVMLIISLQGVSIGLLLFLIFFRFVLHMCGCLLSVGYSEERSYNEIRRSILFFTSLGFILIVIGPSWMQFVHDFQVHPILWYFCSLSLLTLFFVPIFSRMPWCYGIFKNRTNSRTSTRESQHTWKFRSVEVRSDLIFYMEHNTISQFPVG